MKPERTGSPLSRRRFLQISGLTGLALAGGSAVLMAGGGAHYRKLLPPEAKPQVLSEKELAVLFALFDRMFPDEPGWLTARQARLAERIDRELSFHPCELQSDFKSALLLMEHGGLLHLTGTRFTKLSAEEQDALLEKLASGSDLERQAVAAVRVMGNFFYYCDERTWGSIHYQGPLVELAAPPEADSRVGRRAG